jgi:nucleolar protein 6
MAEQSVDNQEKRVRVRSRKNKRKLEETETETETEEPITTQNEDQKTEFAEFKAKAKAEKSAKQQKSSNNKGQAKKPVNIHAVSYTLFISNYPYNTTKEDVEEHFQSCGSLKSVRLLTDKKTKKPKGFGFIDFTDHESSVKALDLHLSSFKGRQIKVALTAGGGGNSETRRNKINEKNKKVKSHIVSFILILFCYI